MTDKPKLNAVPASTPTLTRDLVTPKQRDALNAKKLQIATNALKGAKFAIDSCIMLRGMTELRAYQHDIDMALKALGENVE